MGAYVPFFFCDPLRCIISTSCLTYVLQFPYSYIGFLNREVTVNKEQMKNLVYLIKHNTILLYNTTLRSHCTSETECKSGVSRKCTPNTGTFPIHNVCLWWNLFMVKIVYFA